MAPEKRDVMWKEATERLELMNVESNDVQEINENKSLAWKIVVNHEKRLVKKEAVTEEELQMTKEIENKFGFICYYIIKDEGLWPDGCTFVRYTLPFVDENIEGYEMEREECIESCEVCPAYIVNMEDPDCSEITEFRFVNVDGMIINAS